jgi:RNA polymerase sigma-70 factor (ECF subfamily)
MAMDKTPTTDEDLIESCKKGDDIAFQELMSRYLKHIFNFARQYVRNNEDAEDVTQDTFFKAWKYIQRFKTGNRFKPWIFAIARNNALDHLKKKRAKAFSDMDDTENDIAFADTIVDDEPLAPEIFARAAISDELTASMESLHPDHRAVLIMHYHEGMTFDEIAEIMDKPMNTVKSWHRRSLQKVRDSLEKDHHYVNGA